jgi:23S rRNA (cytidine1920-2'-O)/16S rRNA (cytidine1409-2'-O)-methyltransferase
MPPPPPRTRLDAALLQRGLAPSLPIAQALIMSGRVLLNDRPATKPGSPTRPDDAIRLKPNPNGASGRFVSRGGDKLVHALSSFPIPTSDRVALDVGASTGGFTDCLLQHGARHVFSVDVAYGQFAWSLRNHPQVTLIERTPICALSSTSLLSHAALISPPLPLPDLVVIDVSFTSLLRILPCLEAILPLPFDLITLVKPQFEALPHELEPGGVVLHDPTRQAIIDRTLSAITARSYTLISHSDSPIHGPKGNIERLAWLRFTPPPAPLPAGPQKQEPA